MQRKECSCASESGWRSAPEQHYPCGLFQELGALLKWARDLAKVQTGYELAWQGKGGRCELLTLIEEKRG
jgi:hypothetical protein